MRLSGAEILIKLLENQGIEVVAGIPGGANLPIYDALYRSKIRHILARHEQGAGFIAHGIARSTGKAAVCFATSGPGATNMLTAIADAKLDSIPVIAITGQVSLALMGTDAFQEVDTYGLTLPITKHNFLVRSASELLEVIPKAFKIAQSGRPGPVVVDIPKDAQLEMLEVEKWPEPGYSEIYDIAHINMADIDTAARMINEAKRPVFYFGGGIVNSAAEDILRNVISKSTIPAASTLMGLGCISSEEPLYLGMIGMHGAKYTNYIVSEADLIIAAGVRFDDRAVGNAAKFCSEASVIHIDIDAAEINKIKATDLFIVGDARKVLELMLPKINPVNRQEWLGFVEKMKKEYPFVSSDRGDKLNPLNLLEKISGLLSENDIVSTDVGQHQMWVAQGYPFRKPRKLLTSGGLGTMGFGLPAAIGAAIANQDRIVLSISGDGSLLMNIQELATLAELNLNVKVLVFNNGHLGLVRQQQELFYNENYIACKFETNTNFVLIAQGFGIKSYDVKNEEELDKILEEAISQTGPALVNLPIHYTENVFPMVPPGKAIYEMIGGQ
jgi:acetolactate synthase-1/2/3 large subunit